MAPSKPVKVPAFIDTDKAFDEGVKLAATDAAGDAIIAEIEARQYELLDAWMPDRVEDDVRNRREISAKIAADRRRRADGLAARAKIQSAKDYTADFRVLIGDQLFSAQTTQVMSDEKLANVDLYAVSIEEARDMSMRLRPGMPPPETKGQIELNTLQGRARVQALFEWLDAHKTDGPDEIDDNDMAPHGADVVRQLLGQKPAAASAPSSDDANQPAPEAKP